MWHYKARAYSPAIGRFMQVDPVGYDDQLLLYAYVGNDPMNFRDSTGAAAETIWDAISLAMDVTSMGRNLAVGNYGGAVVDFGGLVLDALATGTPGVPGGAGVGIAVVRLTNANSELRSLAGQMRNIAGRLPDIASAAKSIEGNARDHLKRSDIAGAVGDIFGRNTRGQHLKEVTNALQGMKNSVQQMQKALGNPNLSSKERAIIQTTISKTSNQIDRVQNILSAARRAKESIAE